ncbi:hypothetical protein FOMPIDRAFT_128997 [Fomitopsis schrenkii]|uniref:ABC transmembrane type-1 domain-containing protein n=1 Tax=Fomitopsis schrenkii TaxID=2126942 RepID=S8DS23_FOMSC|nr:hypothetical protein FOMPIDRAFT_128997 [Fomitopsis schrenkii]
MLGIGLIWALVRGWQLTLVGFAIAPVFAVTMAVQTNLVAKCEMRNKRAREEVAKGYYEAISNIRGIRAMGLEGAFQSRFDQSADSALSMGVRGAFVEGCTYGIASALIYLAEALLFYVGAVLMARGTYSYLQMVQVLNLVVFSIHGAISFINVSFAYPEHTDIPVLKDLSLEIAENECMAIIGASGHGKSTITALLQQIYQPNTGLISTGLNEPMPTICDHVAVGNKDISFEDVQRAAKAANVHDFIELLSNYGTLVGPTLADRARADKTCALAHARVVRTALMVTHKLQMMRMCDRIVVVDDGFTGRQQSM